MGGFYIALLSLSFLLILGGSASASDAATTADDVSTVLAVGLLPLGLLGIMMLIDLFTIPGQIKNLEDRVRNDLLIQLVSNKA